MSKPDLSTKFDQHPDCYEKESVVLSGSGVLRKRPPTNYHTASKNVNFAFDHSKQFALLPDGNPRSLIEATHMTGKENNYRTMNRSGKPFALGVSVGGSPDDSGTPLQVANRAKIIKG